MWFRENEKREPRIENNEAITISRYMYAVIIWINHH